jgi:hypothetical protein
VSAADGHVVSTTKIVDHGPASLRWNLVILSEGYKAAELPSFHTHCTRFVDVLFATKPYNELWCAMNIFRVDVASTDSGADNPHACGDGSAGPAADVTVRTFFDARYCVDNTRRLLAGDDALARSTAVAQVPQMHAAIVIVNSAQYGGAGGSVAWFSLDPAASEIGLHELGHSAFNLQDEYSDTINNFPGPEPAAPNVTTITNRATTKWASRIAAATPLPTMPNPDCTKPNNAASPAAAGTVGLFEGAARAHCGLYRPTHNCRMRTLGQPFCPVCQDQIRSVIRPFMPRTFVPLSGVQFTGNLAAGATRRWFTWNWPACWHVAWTVVPTTGGTPGPDLRWRVQVERASRELITYWISVTNLETVAVTFEGRYEVFSRQ